MKIKITLSISLLFIALTVYSKDYNASFFGIESNGTTLNTTSIQKAIDYIHENGGGRLVFYVGRFVTGSIYLKSNVTIHLEEGAVLIGSLNPFDYDRNSHWTALIFAIDQENVGITGKGVIDGRGYQVAQNILSMIHKGIIKDDKLTNDRPNEGLRPQNIYFKGCKNVTIQGIMIKNPASWNQQYDQCKNLLVENITVDSKNYWNNDGIDIVDCDSVIVRNSYFDASDDAICLKSHSADFLCQNVKITHNTIRSSANGIKFGTFSRGGFKNIEIISNTVFDTYRSAITFAAVDGGIVENVRVDSLKSLNTGNPIFLRIGERKPGKKGSMKNISISNVYAEVPATKADAGYPYEGPVEDLPRNVSPASIVGMPDVAIENIVLKNVEIHYPGGANPNYAKLGLDELGKVPELPAKYPEFSMFKELPAWGFYIRHAKGIVFENVTLICGKEDYRTAVVLDDVHGVSFNGLKVEEPEKKKKPVFSHNSTDVKFK
ncbi:MAG: right-handed parallel beta-helix repeat-containing protein [Phycisphaerae bacterium]|nr:right-handed parallel beta-helix repeat-containing protein [Saprospiraceae bacterium]